jgi:hypothetical protein
MKQNTDLRIKSTQIKCWSLAMVQDCTIKKIYISFKMMMGKLDNNMKKNSVVPRSYFIHKNQVKTDWRLKTSKCKIIKGKPK